MTGWLRAAALYNLLFGAWAVLFPGALFTWAGMEAPNYPELWQCIGMIVGVYGIGYAVAAGDPYRHWPIVLVGFLGKVFGPIGFAQALWQGSLPLKFGVILLSNDLVWWIPFAMILRGAYRERLRGRRGPAPSDRVDLP
ncbi:alkyl hydroperoxide reductase [Tautonia sp. JC769]|uniref:alkyl hydroperoxide reductase n=1 Tax=Tautonia sp. JC769 TaxID=3232135 RepID=UPI0034577A46